MNKKPCYGNFSYEKPECKDCEIMGYCNWELNKRKSEMKNVVARQYG